MPATSRVDYGDDESYPTDSYTHYEESTELQEEHCITLGGLNAGTHYHYKITSTDEPNTSTTGDGIFKTPSVVVPPIYGCWHAARKEVGKGGEFKSWLDELNLDPRHRTAGGFGAEVFRRLQESIMASAWQQLGSIEEANEILRRAQLGRESSIGVEKRLESLANASYLRLTSALHNRVVIDIPSLGNRGTLKSKLSEQGFPLEALDPAFRRISRKRSSIRKRLDNKTKHAQKKDMRKKLNY